MSEHELWNELGNLYFMSGAYPQAIYAYQRSIQLDEQFGRPYSNLALAYVQQGKYDEAISLYTRSLELLADNKEQAISWNRLGNVYRHLKEYQEAMFAYQRADELDPENTDSREESDQILYSSSEINIAVQESLKNQELDLQSEQDEEQMTASSLDQGPALPSDEVETAFPVIADPAPYAVDLSGAPEPASATTWMGDSDEDFDPYLVVDSETEVYFPDGDEELGWLPLPDMEPILDDQEPQTFEDSEESDFRFAMDYVVNDPPTGQSTTAIVPMPAPKNTAAEARAYAAQTIAQLDVEELSPTTFVVAEEQEQELIQDQAEQNETWTNSPAIQDGARDTTEIENAIAKFKRVVQINPRNPAAWDALGTLYKSISNYKDAILAYQQAISIDPSRVFYLHHLGLVYAAEGRYEDAIIAYQKVLELDPDHTLTHATLAGYYKRMGLEELAQNHIGKAMKHIYDSENEYNRACFEAICGNVDQAVELLRVALMNRQTYVDWVLHDPDLDAIRTDMRFKQLISEFTR